MFDLKIGWRLKSQSKITRFNIYWSYHPAVTREDLKAVSSNHQEQPLDKFPSPSFIRHQKRCRSMLDKKSKLCRYYHFLPNYNRQCRFRRINKRLDLPTDDLPAVALLEM
ncbi:hypothetical protein KQX54_019356 [Cotesia glomerata]|uniref:Uncharacterized protein n=1 Tax=Cotesia glomerata TaxID=32391 RepID=A0AAV7IX54_COTGL|nr:hypothetical protein KQX54_019356 [Cotesia glomerata]